MKKAVVSQALLCLLFAVHAFAASKPEKTEQDMYSVLSEIVPILSTPGAQYEDNNGYLDGKAIEGVVVYGNRVWLHPVSQPELQRFRDSWREIVSPEDGKTLGYVSIKGLEKFPEYRATEPRHYLVVRENPELALYPGKNDPKHTLAAYGFSLTKGEVVTSRGEKQISGETWLLLEFSTRTETGDSGLGARYVWTRAGDLLPLSAYKADAATVDDALLPEKMRIDASAYAEIATEIRAGLKTRGFAVDPRPLYREYFRTDDLADCYSASGEFEANFITSDIFLHAFHLIFDHMLQKVEQTYFAPQLDSCMAAALDKLEKLRPFLSSEDGKAAYALARDMFEVTRALLAEDFGGVSLSYRAAKETQKMLAAGEVTESLISGRMTDYTLARPRGHYTVLPGLDRYFRAVSWLGLAGLPLFDAEGKPLFHNIAASLLISLCLDEGSWDAFEAPLDFLVGSPDDGSLRTYRQLARKHLGADEAAAQKLTDTSMLEALASDIRTSIAGAAIRSEPGDDERKRNFAPRSPVFYISGKRFVYDAFIFTKLTSPSVGTDQHPRNLPQGTDVMAVLGSRAAEEFAAGNNKYENYAANLRELKNGLDKALTLETFYTRMLAALRAGFQDSGVQQFFYRNPAWQWKKLLTASASWAELKHDTILYGKQSGAEMGEGGEWHAGKFSPPAPRGYVEPDPQTFAALLETVDTLRTFLKRFNLEKTGTDANPDVMGEYAEKLGDFAKLLEQARIIAGKEAGGEALAPEDYRTIWAMARAFTPDLLLPRDLDFIEDSGKLKMALVADVATDYLAGRVLEVATGTPRAIYVFVNDASGGARITRGYIFSYYEFASGERLTDETWKELVYDESRAAELEKLRPDWLRQAPF